MAKEKTDSYIGQLLVNRYRLQSLIGKGSMGRVYLAEDQLLGGVIVAVKFLAQMLLNSKMKERFASEAQTGAQLGQRSLHIVRVLDYGVHSNDVPFYVMEYLEGKNLSDLIFPTPVAISRFLVLMRHICAGLKCAHEGINRNGERTSIVHRDIKPSNVFVIKDPSLGELGKVLDFGIAKFLTDQVESRESRSFMGTLAYCSPEQIEGKDLDARSDIYSLGITMFEVLTGKMPIEPETHSIGSWYQAHRSQKPKRLSTANSKINVSKDLEELVMGCMEKSPRNRPQSMEEIIERLEKMAEPQPSAITSETFPQATPQKTPDALPQVEADLPAIVLPPEPSGSVQPKATILKRQQQFWALEDAGWKVSWPEKKPVAEIVFPEFVTSQDQKAVGLWVMLQNSEIERRLLSARYNHFLFLLEPHPLVLWITTIYDSALGARWLPCYLDLKSKKGEQTAMLLAQKGYYPLIYFALEHPEQPANVKTFTISPEQCNHFQNWVGLARQIPARGALSVSKDFLKKAFEKEKPKILQKLHASSTPLKFID